MQNALPWVYIQLTPDNSNLPGKSKKVRIIESSSWREVRVVEGSSYRESTVYTQGIYARTFDNLFRFPLKFRVIGSQLHMYATLPWWWSLSDPKSYAGWDLSPWQVQSCRIGRGGEA